MLFVLNNSALLITRTVREEFNCKIRSVETSPSSILSSSVILVYWVFSISFLTFCFHWYFSVTQRVHGRHNKLICTLYYNTGLKVIVFKFPYYMDSIVSIYICLLLLNLLWQTRNLLTHFFIINNNHVLIITNTKYDY